MAILSNELREKRALAEAELKAAKNFKRILNVQSVGVEPLTLGNQTIECLKVYYNGIYGYVPKNKMDDYEFRSLLSFANNEEFPVLIEEILSDESDTFFVANRKDALEKQAEQFWKTVKKGQIYKAFISGVDKTNVWLIINGVRVRMSKDEYSYTYHHDLREVVAIGESLDVKVIDIVEKAKTEAKTNDTTAEASEVAENEGNPEELNAENENNDDSSEVANAENDENKEENAEEPQEVERKLVVSHRVLEADPKDFLKEYKPGSNYVCEIKNIDFEYGVFVSLAPRGISALASFPPTNIGKHLKAGDKVQFKVTRLDFEKGYIFGHIVLPRAAQIKKAQHSW